MKNRQSTILVVITCMFLSFTLGFLSGRLTAPGDTIITRISDAPEVTAPPSPVSPESSDLSTAASESSTSSAPSETTAASTAAAETAPPLAESEATDAPPAVTDSIVPQTQPTEQTVPSTPPAESSSNLLNINTATLAQLDSLPGIGPVIAQRIIDYREANGPFKTVSQLTLVEGIGEKRLAAIIDLITVE